ATEVRPDAVVVGPHLLRSHESPDVGIAGLAHELPDEPAALRPGRFFQRPAELADGTLLVPQKVCPLVLTGEVGGKRLHRARLCAFPCIRPSRRRSRSETWNVFAMIGSSFIG